MSAAFSHGYALLVGVGQDLPCTVADASAMADLLRDPLRAAYPAEQVQLLTEADATREKVLAAFERLRKQTLADPDATAIVYFSGHGVRLGKAAELARHYLLCHGYDLTRPAETCVSDRELTDALRWLYPKKLLVLLDCCHAAGIPLLKGDGPAAEPSLPPAALTELDQGEGRVIFASCRDDERSYTGHPNSLFTAALLEALSGKAAPHLGFARVLEVIAYVMREVPLRHPRQHPFLNRAESLSESFPICRVPPPPAPEPPAAKAAPLAEWKRTALRRKLDAHLPAYETRLKKLETLRVAHAVTADAALKFQYEAQIAVLEGEVQKDEGAIEKLHAELGDG